MKIGISGTGSYIPSVITTNQDFHEHQFLNPDGSSIPHENALITRKFKAITGIVERRYAEENLCTSDMGYLAAEKAIADSGVDRETLDQIIYAHNFGDIRANEQQSDTVPALASRVKHLLKIKNPNCVAYDLLFGCPGWVQGIIHAHTFIKAGVAKKCLVIGGETLSRVLDPHDRDSMIFADGAGATIIEAQDNGGDILAHSAATFSEQEVDYLYMGASYRASKGTTKPYIKMYGRKIYEFALKHVPEAMRNCIDKSGVDIAEVKKIFLHQANEKMDEAIVERLYKLYGMEYPKSVLPMNIHKLGNSSVATIPTLLDMVRHGKMEDHSIQKGDVVIFASVGAGMNINAIVYRY